MAKKIFVSKNAASQSRPPYVKYLLWGAVGLVVLILVAPLFQQKGNKGTQRGQEKGGVVVGEIPRTGQPASDDAPILPGQSPDVGKTGDMRVMPIPPEIKGFTDVPPKNPVPETAPAEKPARGNGTSAKSPAGEAGVKKEGSGEMAGALPGSAPAKEMGGAVPDSGLRKPKPDAGSPPTAETPPAAGGSKQKEAPVQTAVSKTATEEQNQRRPADKSMYTVQVGTFQEKRHADEMQQNLTKRGYKVVVRLTKHPKLGEIHVVQLEPVSGIDKANTLVAQIRNEQKVNPIIQKVSKGE
jgi:cell division septation protein DedD